METNVNALFANYGEVGFMSIVDPTLALLMLVGDHGRPNIGFASHNGCHFTCLMVDFELRSVQNMETAPWFMKVRSVGFVTVFNVYIIACR